MGEDKYTYTYETVAHEIDRNLFMTDSGKIVEGNLEVGDRVVVMHVENRPMPVYRTRVEPVVEEPPTGIVDLGGKGKLVEVCKTPVEIEYITDEMQCGETQELTAVGCLGPYVWELVQGGGPGGGELEETEEPREGMKHTTAGVDPSSSDDYDDGYRPWSRWHNTVTDKYFVCVDAAVGEAVWIEYKPPPDGGLGDSIKYTAPDTNPNCEHNAKIRVKDYYKNFPDPPGYPTQADLDITVQCYTGTTAAYRVWECHTYVPYDCRYQTPPRCIRFICGYSEYRCDGQEIQYVAVNSWEVNRDQKPPPPGLPDYCGNHIDDCTVHMGGYLYYRYGSQGCIQDKPYCVGHYDGEIEDVRTEAMKQNGCCPAALM